MDLIKKRKLDENGGFQQSDASDAITKLTLEDARKFIEPFTQDQLLDILQHALLRHPDVLDAVRSIADRDLTQRKLFVRGLGWDTTTENLRILFSSYGDLEEAAVILDKVTGKSKGFGFVTFKHVDGALLALKEPSKKIDGRMTVTQLAAAGSSGPVANAALSQQQSVVDVSARKIYVATVPFDMSADRLLAHFSSYGEVEEGPLGFDKQTGKSKGFALFVYKTAEGARAALVDPTKNIDGRQMVCKLAIDGKKNKPVQQTQQAPAAISGLSGNQSDGVGADGHGVQPSSVQGSMPSQYGGPGGPVGISAYGGFSGGLQVHPALAHHHHFNSFPSSIGGPGLSSAGGVGPGLSSGGGQMQSALIGSGGYGAGLGGPYGGLHYGGPGSTGFGGFPGAGSGLGGAGGGSSLYARLPPGSVGMPTGGYAEGAHYSLSSSSAFPGQQHQPAGTSPAPRVPPGGMYSGMPSYY